MNVFVQGISRSKRPVVKPAQDHCLAHCREPQVCLETENLKRRNFYLQCVEGRSSLWFFNHDVSSSLEQYFVYSIDTVLGTENLCLVHGFQNSGICKQKCAVCHSPARRDYLSSSSEDWLVSDLCLENLKLDIFYGLFAQRSLPSGPLKSLNQRVLYL